MPPLRFRKIHVSDERYESCGVFDVNNDGVLDIVSGAWWYPGPTFQQKCPIGTIRAEGEYFDDFSTIPMDVNGDGYLDFITGGWFGRTLHWRENPRGDPRGEWPLHDIAECGNVETTRAWDVDGDGRLEIVPNTPPASQKFYKLITGADGRGTGKFQEVVVREGPSGHGLGFGDINGDGRGDIVLAGGWLEAPEDPIGGKWVFHDEFDLGSASIPIIVADVNGDGLNDLIVGQAHPYGLDWWEQRVGKGGRRTWIKHPIDPYNSQYHDMWWIDLDGDGRCELVTGKRVRGHAGKDPGGREPECLYYYTWDRAAKEFTRHTISPPGGGVGTGMQLNVTDLTGDGRPDIAVSGKTGTWVLVNEGKK